MSTEIVHEPGPMEQAILDWRESRVSSATTFKYTHDRPDLLAFAREQDALVAELLAALEAMLPENWEPQNFFANRADSLQQARAAIARAKGRCGGIR